MLCRKQQQNQKNQKQNNNNTATDEKPARAKTPKRTIKGAVRELFAPATPREDRNEERRVEQPAVTQSARGLRQYQSKDREMGNWRTNSPQPEGNGDTVRNDETGRPSSVSSVLSRRKGEKWWAGSGWAGAVSFKLMTWKSSITLITDLVVFDIDGFACEL